MGLTAGAVLAFLHHRRVVPLMERPLRIFEMTETADPIALMLTVNSCIKVRLMTCKRTSLPS
jgi:hypothetical protein